MSTNTLSYIDSHTEGEPTRVITSGIPDLGTGNVAEQLKRLREEDWLRRCVILEPRGWEAIVGAVLCQPSDPRCAAGVIFINNAGYLNMCGHGTIGLAVTLHYMGRIELGKHLFETPVGLVEVDLLDANTVALENVPSYRTRKQIRVEVDGLGGVVGDVAWGGNWFFLAKKSPCDIDLENLDQLKEAAGSIRRTLREQNITGDDGGEIDHIEFFGPARSDDGNSRNYVYCPGGAYDRSPCGTGTSAKVACLAADEKLQPGETWIQESIIGSRFSASYRWNDDGQVVPRIVGRAYVCGEGNLIRQPTDPFVDGIGL